MPMKLGVGDVVELKKPHPCGSKAFTITRVGMDFRIRCLQCGSQMRLSRPKTGEKYRAHNISERKNFSGLKFRRTV